MLSEHLRLDIEEFKKWLKFNGASENTVLGYVSDLKNCFLFDVAGKKNVEEYTIDEWRSILSKLQDNNLSYKSQERYLAALRSFAKYKKNHGIDLSLSKITSLRKKESEHISNVDFDDIMHFLSFFDKTEDNWVKKRDRALVYILYSVGLRINEALSLKWTNIFSKYIKIKGKGGRIRDVPFFPFIKKMFLDYREALNFENEYIFVSNSKIKRLHACVVARMFRRVSISLGLKNITPHTLRHACATHLLKSGCNLRSIQALLGHSSLEITKIYINSTMEDLKNEYFSIV